MKKKLLILIVSGTILLVSSYLYLSKVSYKKELVINIGDNIPEVKDYIKNKIFMDYKDATIKWDNLEITKAGLYHGIIKIKEKEYKVSLVVEDKEAPTINCDEEIKVLKNEKVNIKDAIEVTDNSSDELIVDINGDYNIKKVGKYEVEVTAKDSSENTSSKKIILNVISEAEKNGNTVENIGTTSKGYQIQKIDGIYYVDGVLIANKTYSLPSTYNPGGLLAVFNDSYNQMVNDASKQGVNLFLKSGFRSYQSQSTIYNNYVAKDGYTKADTYSARPGYSEHQTGLAADINSLSISFINTKEGMWLNSNCYKYGFIIRYVKNKDNITGYMYEPWHIRYVGVELATELYNNGDWITLEEYYGITSSYN